MTNPTPHGQVPEALRLADTLDLAPENGIEPQTSEDAAAELRRLHTENTALQQGYAAARLEIESLQAGIKTMAEEHADELMVAHLDGRVRAAQPAGAQQPTTQTAPASQGDALDAARLDWLLLRISGAEFRRIGVHYSGNASRADVDAARKQGANHD